MSFSGGSLEFSDEVKAAGLRCARDLADWFVRTQELVADRNPGAGNAIFHINPDGGIIRANNWNNAFIVMGLLTAARSFHEPAYEEAALDIARYLKTLQIFSPFEKEHYGAIREMTPQTPWCYTRDALSVAWAFIELYRYTGEAEYLERAQLWAEWFLRHGMDETGWPHWLVRFEPFLKGKAPSYAPRLHGCFHGGSLNFFYELYLETGDRSWVGGFFEHIADYFVEHIQQPSGFFLSIDKKTMRPPEDDPQKGLHRANDDLGCLGLLRAYRILGHQSYLDAINRFLNHVFARQDDAGNFETSCAAIPVVLYTLRESGGRLAVNTMRPGALELALKALYARQYPAYTKPISLAGGLDEFGDGSACARSGAYALILLLKLFGGAK